VPIFNHEGQVVAAISISGTIGQIHAENVGRLAELVISSGAKISSALGHCPPHHQTSQIRSL
jgi:DNA-binding IclR family transcriptional regulator